MSVAECVDVSVSYGPRLVLDDVSCHLDRGDRVALVGRSGSGKTTLLHLLGGLEQPSEGAVFWPDLDGGPRHRASLAFQSPSLLAALDVLENVGLPLVLAGAEQSDADEAAARMLALLDLEPLARQLPEELSGGQAQRVALARALVTRPALLLCDEPTGQVDHRTAALLLEALLSVAADLGTAVVIATHDTGVAGLMDRRWDLRDGRLES